MTGRTSARLAWTVWSAFVLIVVAHAYLEFRVGKADEYLSSISVLSGFVAFATVGVVICVRRPGNVIGWIYLAGASGAMAGNLASTWSDLAQERGLPGATWSQLLSSTAWLSSVAALVVFTFLLYPNGRPPSSRWRPVVWAAGAALVGGALSVGLAPGPIESNPDNPENPIGLDALSPVLNAIGAVSFPLLLVAILASIASLFLRYRKVTGDTRQQLKWLAWAGAVMVVLASIQAPVSNVFGDYISSFLAGVGIAIVPLATGLAILHYGLYDIDRVISRTVSYAIVTAVLAGMFALLVLLPVVLGVDEAPDYVIAIATLVVAALFRPVRRRVQTAIDHRFNRRRYDAERTIETFTARLREQVDIDALGAELRGVVDRTMQPTHTTLWLRAAR